MYFPKKHRREPIEPQLAAMIDVFSILIIFLIAGTTMDSSVIELPGDLLLAKTTSKSSTLNAPQVTLRNGIVYANFINEKISIKLLNQNNPDNNEIKNITLKLKEYLKKIDLKSKDNLTNTELLQSINLVADKETLYSEIYNTIKFFRGIGFLNSILVGTEGGGT